jgi:glycosyltransferase involved in cell wall biosynthesis
VLKSTQFGGMERHVGDLIRASVDTYEVYVWSTNSELKDYYENFGAKVQIQNIHFGIDPFYIINLAKFLIKNEIAVVHIHEFRAVANATIACKLAGVCNVITHTHTPISEWKISAFKRIFNTKINSFLVNHFSKFEIALTTSRKAVKVLEGISESKLKVIPNCVNDSFVDVDFSTKESYRREIFSKYNISSDTFVFGNISRFTLEKGHDTLLRAFADFIKLPRVLTQGDKFKLLLVGSGVLKKDIELLAKRLQIDEYLIFAGSSSEEDLIKYFCSFDVFVFPTLAEGFGLVLVEAMALGVPTVCSDLEVLQEVAGSTVFYFDTGNSMDLASKLLEIYSKKDNLQLLAENAASRVHDLYSFNVFKSSYLNLYQSLLTS